MEVSEHKPWIVQQSGIMAKKVTDYKLHPIAMYRHMSVGAHWKELH